MLPRPPRKAGSGVDYLGSMITKFIQAVFVWRKLHLLLFLAIGVWMAKLGSESLLTGATKDGLMALGLGVIFAGVALLGYWQMAHQEKTALENPVINFIERAASGTLAPNPELAEAWNIIAKKTGIEGKNFASIPGKQWEELMATDVEAYEAWRKVQEIAKRDYFGK